MFIWTSGRPAGLGAKDDSLTLIFVEFIDSLFGRKHCKFCVLYYKGLLVSTRPVKQASKCSGKKCDRETFPRPQFPRYKSTCYSCGGRRKFTIQQKNASSAAVYSPTLSSTIAVFDLPVDCSICKREGSANQTVSSSKRLTKINPD